MASFKLVRRTAYFSLASLLIVVVLAWCALFSYARVYQHRATALMRATLSLRPGTSTFSDAKRIADRYAEYQDTDSDYETHLASTSCTPDRCDFELHMSNRFERIAFFHWIHFWEPEWKARIAGFARTLGLRPVTTDCRIEVRNGKVARTHTGYSLRLSEGGLAGAGVTAVKAFTVADRCRLRGSGEFEFMRISEITAGGGSEILVAYPMTATEETRRRATTVNFSCMTRIPECRDTPFSIVPISQEMRQASPDPDPELLNKCYGMSDQEGNRFAFGSID